MLLSDQSHIHRSPGRIQSYIILSLDDRGAIREVTAVFFKVRIVQKIKIILDYNIRQTPAETKQHRNRA